MNHFDTSSPWGTWKARGCAAFCLKLISCLPASRSFRKVAFVLRKPVKHSKQAWFDREVWGLKMRLAAQGNLTEQRWLTMPHFHDVPEREALSAALRPGGVFLDVGANAGFYTFWALSRKVPDLRVISVEPSRVMLDRLRYNLLVNQLESSVTLFDCAVTPHACEVVMEEHAENAGQATVREGGLGQKVAGRTLLEILESAGVEKVDAMKIDIEGMEVPVLEAFFEKAPRSLWPGFIVGEIVGENGEPLKRLLLSRGYQLQSSTKMNGILRLTE